MLKANHFFCVLMASVTIVTSSAKLVWAQLEQQGSSNSPRETALRNVSTRSSSNDLHNQDVELSKKILLSVTMGKDQTPVLRIQNEQPDLDLMDSKKIQKALMAILKKSDDCDGIVIRAAKEIQYKTVARLLSDIRSSQDTTELKLPVSFSVVEQTQEPQQVPTDQTTPRVQDAKQATPQGQGNSTAESNDQDEVITREFVLKNKQASEVYSRISRVGRLLGVEVRLDPNRNSITVKGATKHVTGIRSILNNLDGSNTDSNASSTDTNKNDANVVRRGAEFPNTNAIPSRSLPGSANRNVNAAPVGKYQMSAVGNNLFLLDTSTGESWFLNTGGEKMFWSKLPHPSDQ